MSIKGCPRRLLGHPLSRLILDNPGYLIDKTEQLIDNLAYLIDKLELLIDNPEYLIDKTRHLIDIPAYLIDKPEHLIDNRCSFHNPFTLLALLSRTKYVQSIRLL